MTLQQLRYVTAIAETGTLSEAARRFYIAQPSLTASLRERFLWGGSMGVCHTEYGIGVKFIIN